MLILNFYIHVHIGEPSLPPWLNIFRSLSFLLGAIGSVIALLAFKYPNTYGGNIKYYILASAVFVLFLIGLSWYRRWESSTSFQPTIQINQSINKPVLEMSSLYEIEEPKPNYVLKFENGSWIIQ